jgi:hypothetical protein
MQKGIKFSFEFVIIAIVLVAHLYVFFAPANNLMSWYTTDDAFYYFKTAQNFGEGRGITFDGFGRTNGFHPLWFIICVPVFLLARIDLVLPLRVIVLVSAALSAGTAILIFRTLKRVVSKYGAMAAALLWIMTVEIHSVTTTLGMESGVNVFTLALLVYLVVDIEIKRGSGRVTTGDIFRAGVAATLAMMARLDNGFTAAAMGLWLMLRLWHTGFDSGDESPWKKRWLVMWNYFAPMAITLGVYMLGSQLYFGTPLPVSGTIKRWWGTLPNTVYGFPVDSFLGYLGNWVTPIPDLGPWSLITRIPHAIARTLQSLFTFDGDEQTLKFIHRYFVLGVSLVLGVGLAAIIKARWTAVKKNAVVLALIPFFIGCAFQISAYKATGYVETLRWYWAGEMLWTILAAGVLLGLVISLLEKINIKENTIKLVTGLVGILMLVQFGSYLTGLISYEVLPGEEEAYMAGARALEKYTESGAVIGSTGGGVGGYFIKDRTIVNLDGLINSYEYFHLLRRVKAAEYYDRIGLDYVYGNIYMVTESDPYARNFAGRLELIGTVERASLFRYIQTSR